MSGNIAKVLKNVFSNWASLGINLVISFFLAPFVVSHLGSTYYGIWVIMMQFTGYLYLLDFGIRESVIRYVSKYEASAEYGMINLVVSSALRVYGFVGLLCFIIAVGLAVIFPIIFNLTVEAVPAARIVVVVTGVNMAQFFMFNVFVGVLMGAQRFDAFNKISIIFAFIRLGLIVWFLNKGYGIIALAYIQLFINLSSNIAILFSAKKVIPIKIQIWGKIDNQREILKSVINYSFFVLLINICQKIIFYTDALIIGMFLPSAAITYYAIAGNLIEYLRRLVASMAGVLNPLSSELDAKQEFRKIADVLIQGTRFALLIGMPICTVYFVLGERFIYLWMGSEYARPAGQVLLILAVVHLFSLPNLTVNMILYGTSRHKVIAYIKIFEAAANLVLSLVLVKPFGIVGVALGTAIPHIIVVAIIFPIIISKMVGIGLFVYLYQGYFGPLISAIPFGILCVIARTHYSANSLIDFFGLIFILLPSYLIPAWIVSFSKEERKWHLSLLVPMLRLKKN